MPIQRATSNSPSVVSGQARVSKRLTPGQNGTKRFQAQYGAAPICVRYRQDSRKRYTTVELIVDQHDLPPPSPSRKDFVAVAIGYQEKDLRVRAEAMGATWAADIRLWIMPRSLAKRLGLEGRVQSLKGDGQ
jgi:hypothetical protein